jgi:hypothetical protein
MAISVQKLRGAAATSLGFIQVTTSGNAVPLSTNIDANNVNAPGTLNQPVAQFPGTQTEYSPSFRGYKIYGFKPAANNAGGMVVNTGSIYLLSAPAGTGSGNRSDPGSILAIIGAGNSETFPPEGTGLTAFSPYNLYLDADNNNDGALVVAYGGSGLI